VAKKFTVVCLYEPIQIVLQKLNVIPTLYYPKVDLFLIIMLGVEFLPREMADPVSRMRRFGLPDLPTKWLPAQFRSSAASNGTRTSLLPTLSCESKARTELSTRVFSFSDSLRG
jgi:hypothetical protein